MAKKMNLLEPAGVRDLLQRPGAALLAALLETQHVRSEARQRIYNSVEPAPALHVVGDDAQCFCGSHLCWNASMASMRTAHHCSTEAANMSKRAMRPSFLQRVQAPKCRGAFRKGSQPKLFGVCGQRDTLGFKTRCDMQPFEYRSVRYWSKEIGTRTGGRKK